jgi:hypothetical protein
VKRPSEPEIPAPTCFPFEIEEVGHYTAALRLESNRGVYLNLVEGLLWVQDVEGSNPFTPTTRFARRFSSRLWSGSRIPPCKLAFRGQ